MKRFITILCLLFVPILVRATYALPQQYLTNWFPAGLDIIGGYPDTSWTVTNVVGLQVGGSTLVASNNARVIENTIISFQGNQSGNKIQIPIGSWLVDPGFLTDPFSNSGHFYFYLETNVVLCGVAPCQAPWMPLTNPLMSCLVFTNHAQIGLLGGRKDQSWSPVAQSGIGVTNGYVYGSTSLMLSNVTGLVSPSLISVYELLNTNEVCNALNGGSGGNLTYLGEDSGPDPHTHAQYTSITNITGNTITIWPPIYDTTTNPPGVFIRRQSCKVAQCGIENLQLKGIGSSFDGIVDFEFTINCWMRGVETYDSGGSSSGSPHIWTQFSYGNDYSRNYFHYGPNHDSGQNYGIEFYHWNGRHKIENNIITETRHSIVNEGGNSGSVFIYNYTDDNWESVQGFPAVPNAQLVSEDIIVSHGAHPHENLYEGNACIDIDSDVTQGSSSWNVISRNSARSYRSSYPYFTGPSSAAYYVQPFDAQYYNNNFAYIDNIAGSPSNSAPSEFWGTNGSAVATFFGTGSYLTHYGAGGSVPRSFAFDKVGTGGSETNTSIAFLTVTMQGNYDFQTKGIQRWDSSDHVIPLSFYYTNTPDWMTNINNVENWGISTPFAIGAFDNSKVTPAQIDATNIQAGALFEFGPSTNTTINFNISEPCKTSAGIYDTNGNLCDILWNNQFFYTAGNYTTNWNDIFSDGTAATNGNYVVKVLTHNVQYIWDGVVGNTSYSLNGLGVHNGFLFIQDMSIENTNNFYCSGYNEGKYGFRMFNTATPQTLTNSWFWISYENNNPSIINAPGQATRNWNFTAADTNRVYFACPDTFSKYTANSHGSNGCVVCSSALDQSYTTFSSGVAITNDNDQIPNGIYVGVNNGVSGLAVQQGGGNEVLAVSVTADNKVYMFDKLTGAALTPASFSINAPGRMNFATNGDLWVANTNSVQRWTTLTGTPTLSQTISTGLSSPLAVAVDPVNTNFVIVADGGTNQQVFAFTAGGTPIWTYGQAGGYYTNGVVVATNKFWFQNYTVNSTGGTVRTNIATTFLTFAADGQSFWVGDGWNLRVMQFDTNHNYLNQIMYQPASYACTVDKANPSRVFNNFLEFSIDYTKPLSNAWTLVNNWGVNVDTNHNIIGLASGGFYGVITMTNGHTYALIDNMTNRFGHSPQQYVKELIELVPTNGVRFTYTYPGEILGTNTDNSFNTNGDILNVTSPGNIWWTSPLTGFDGSNNPIYGTQVQIATAPATGSNPVNQNTETFKTTVFANGNIICFDDSVNTNFHLGAIPYNGTNFVWRASPAGAFFDGHGTYEISNGVNYAGSDVQAIDHNIIFGYHGEFFRSQGQASQRLHYYDDGLFIGQFGEAAGPGLGYPTAWILNSFNGNGVGPSMVKTNSEYYIYENDESAHGPSRWHLVNAPNMFEQSGYVSLNGTVTLTNPAISFPTVINARASNACTQISWKGVSGATYYRTYQATNNGGQFIPVGISYLNGPETITNLINGTTYYFEVTATVGGVESARSEQVKVTPWDSTQNSVFAGQQEVPYFLNNINYNVSGVIDKGLPVIEINSNAPASGAPSVLDTVHAANFLTSQDEDNYGYGNLMNESIGTLGGEIFSWGGSGVNFTNLVIGYAMAPGGTWTVNDSMFRKFWINGATNTDLSNTHFGLGLFPNTTGSYAITVPDNGWRYLTAYFPCRGSSRTVSATFTPTLGGSVVNVYNDLTMPEPNGANNMSIVDQFLIKGGGTLTITGNNSALQALFLDNTTNTFLPEGQQYIPFSIKATIRGYFKGSIH